MEHLQGTRYCNSPRDFKAYRKICIGYMQTLCHFISEMQASSDFGIQGGRGLYPRTNPLQLQREHYIADTIDTLDCYLFSLLHILCIYFDFNFICLNLLGSISTTFCGLIHVVFSLCPSVWYFSVLVTSQLLWQNTMTKSILEVEWVNASLMFQRR